MKAVERRPSHSAASLRRSPILRWVSLDSDTGCQALSVAGIDSLCTNFSVAALAILSDRSCTEVNFCTSSVATANIPSSKIIGNQKNSGTAQLLEVGPRSRMSIVRRAFAILEQSRVGCRSRHPKQDQALSKPGVEVVGSESQFSVKQNFLRNLSTVRNSAAPKLTWKIWIHDEAFGARCRPSALVGQKLIVAHRGPTT